ncbi:MAG: hypothetical protein FWF92_07630 [Oscillospiraceae bacterium]|nr:hypothetical protein [Oscillospiraceae bacterium]
MNEMRNSNMNNKQMLEECLDHIVTYLENGSHWHRQMAGELRKPALSLRGFSRWHECESKCDYCSIICIEKIARDKLDYDPQIKVDGIERANSFMLNNANDFKNSFNIWIKNEEELVECLNHAIEYARAVDIQMYKELMGLADEVQGEIMRASMAYHRLANGGFTGHDLYVVSTLLHNHFEKSDNLDFTLS